MKNIARVIAMVIKSSGRLTFDEIVTEFGGTKPYKINTFYGIVPGKLHRRWSHDRHAAE